MLGRDVYDYSAPGLQFVVVTQAFPDRFYMTETPRCFYYDVVHETVWRNPSGIKAIGENESFQHIENVEEIRSARCLLLAPSAAACREEETRCMNVYDADVTTAIFTRIGNEDERMQGRNALVWRRLVEWLISFRTTADTIPLLVHVLALNGTAAHERYANVLPEAYRRCGLLYRAIVARYDGRGAKPVELDEEVVRFHLSHDIEMHDDGGTKTVLSYQWHRRPPPKVYDLLQEKIQRTAM